MARKSVPRPKGRSRPPMTVDEKIVCAKSVIQAVVAAHDAAQDMGNYDIHWPLCLAVEILEQAANQFGENS
jgi:hypothetical protein